MLKSAVYIHEHTDWDISFICAYDENFERLLPDYIHYYPVDMKRGVSVDGLSAVRKMKKIFKREKFDMVQYSTPNAAFYASIAAKAANIPIRNYHLMGYRYQGSSGAGRVLLKQIEKIACRNATHIECVSNSSLHIGIGEGLFPAEKAVVVWNGSTGGVDLKRFNVSKRMVWRNKIRSELNLTENDFVYGFVGRVTRDKGLNELLEAFLNLKKNAKLLIIGNTENEQSLNDGLLEKARSNSNVVFIPYAKDIERYYAALDVLVLPSYREGFGNVVIEAAAVGTPAIVSDIPGPTDAIVREKTAFTVEPGSADELKDAMIKIRECDCKAMGYEAAKYVKEHFDSEILCEKILERKLALFAETADGEI